jgi:GSH-dependent disulfide-bond oxidoreductase
VIDFHAYQTSNAQRVGIMLEACGLPYRTHIVNLQKGEQRDPAFLAINPAGAVPAIVDHDPPGGGRLALSQSGAILLYLAMKTGRYFPVDPALRAQAFQWFMLATTDCASATSMMYYSTSVVPDKSPANAEFFGERLLRHFRVIDERLAGRDWLADELSIADFALYPIYMSRRALLEGAGLSNVARWVGVLGARGDVARGMAACTPA